MNPSACWSRILLLLIACACFRAPSNALEADCRACNFCIGQPDLLSALDERIRAHILANRTPSEIASLESGDSLIRPEVERWASSMLGAVKPDRKRLKYHGSRLPDNFLFCSFEPSILLNKICIGTDKLGHFFQTGWEYFQIAVIQGKGDGLARRYGEWLEGVAPRENYAADELFFREQRSGRAYGYGGFGRAMSGVISRADLAANEAGLRFYRDLTAGQFKTMAAYVTTNWCEELNPNSYVPEMAALVEKNIKALTNSSPGYFLHQRELATNSATTGK